MMVYAILATAGLPTTHNALKMQWLIQMMRTFAWKTEKVMMIAVLFLIQQDVLMDIRTVMTPVMMVYAILATAGLPTTHNALKMQWLMQMMRTFAWNTEKLMMIAVLFLIQQDVLMDIRTVM